ncbi:hypothetical protein FQZ97_1000400 [compost metagenome]
MNGSVSLDEKEVVGGVQIGTDQALVVARTQLGCQITQLVPLYRCQAEMGFLWAQTQDQRTAKLESRLFLLGKGRVRQAKTCHQDDQAGDQELPHHPVRGAQLMDYQECEQRRADEQEAGKGEAPRDPQVCQHCQRASAVCKRYRQWHERGESDEHQRAPVQPLLRTLLRCRHAPQNSDQHQRRQGYGVQYMPASVQAIQSVASHRSAQTLQS